MIGRIIRIVLIVAGCLAILIVAAAAALNFLFAPSRDEVSRVASPSGDIVAVLIEVNGGATTPFGYEVHLTLPEDSTSELEVAFLYGAVVNGHFKLSHLWSLKLSHTDSFYKSPLIFSFIFPFNR